jgi:DNA-binding transcriptional ArsR family regulator
MTAVTQSDTQARLIKGLAHPLRHRILIRLNERQASPSVLAKDLDEPLGNVSYHVKILLENELIELVDTRPVRGAIEHIYRATARPFFEDEHWTELPVSLRRALFDPTLQKAWEHIVTASKNGGLDDPETHISWTPLDLDRRGYEEMVALLAETLERALAIQSDAAGRLAEQDPEDRETERTELTVMHYHRPRGD